jgi:hypothetical protein
MSLIPSYEKVVTGFTINSGGSNYASPTIDIDGGGGTGATAEATVVSGKITAITITNQGSGYSTPPTVTVVGGGGTGADIDAIIGALPYKNKLEFLIQEQLPEFVQNEYAGFVTFLEGYYRFLDQSGEVNNFLLNARDYSDVDTTLEAFIDQFRKQYAVDIPKNVLVNQRRLVKLISDFYESKGAEDSIELLFKILYDETVEFFYPSTHILKASDGVWIEDVVVRILGADGVDPFDLSGRICKLVYYENTGVQTFPKTIETTVTNVKKLAYTSPAIYELNVSLPKNSPLKVPGAGAIATLTITGGSVTSVTVVSGGSGYYAAPIVILNDTAGLGAVLRANIVNGSVSSITVVQGGSGYVEDAENIQVVFSTDTIRTEIFRPLVPATTTTAEIPETLFGYVIRQLSTVEVVSCSGAGINGDCGFRVGQIYKINEQETVGPYVKDPPMSPVSTGLISAIAADPADYGAYNAGTFNAGINEPFFDALGQYTLVGRDNRASVRISSINAGGCVTAVTIFNTGFDFEQEEFEATITSPNGCEAVLAFTTGAVLVKTGRFKDSRGMLSNINKLQDNYYYQNYSYVIKSGVTSNTWLPLINKTVHPAGMAVFGELLVTQTIDMVDYIGVLEILVLNEFFIDVIVLNDQTRSVDFHKILTDTVAGSIITYAIPDYVPIEYASMDADSLQVHFYKVLSDSVTLFDTTELLVGIGNQDITSTVDSFDRVVQYVRIFNEAFYTSHTTAVDFGKTVVEDPVWVTRDFWAVPDYSGVEFAWDAEETVVVAFDKNVSFSYITPFDDASGFYGAGQFDITKDGGVYTMTISIDSEGVITIVSGFGMPFGYYISLGGTTFEHIAGEDNVISSDTLNNLFVGKVITDTLTTAESFTRTVEYHRTFTESISMSDTLIISTQFGRSDSLSVSDNSVINSVLNKIELATTLDYFNKVLQISKSEDAETSEIIFIDDNNQQIDLVGIDESSRMIINKGIGDMLGITDSGIINIQDYVEGAFGSDFVGQATYF